MRKGLLAVRMICFTNARETCDVDKFPYVVNVAAMQAMAQRLKNH